MKCSNLVMFLCVISALVLLRAPTAVEAACSIAELTPCASAILSSAKPSSLCCSRLQAQSSCFCEYKNDPNLSKYFTGGQKVAADCGVSIPSCN
ncbi:hypothetical protein Cni_G15942 [Canna indica]|uniref:Bifunctional inhibitor/plant lipid transfer protein/seed storage helical domain-containing protein n=1 Tax=Canna indica TaxID=4628 RepID=A0AAQ3KF93_9LILI|nr:hypothetical protein Cni_G15942 [Canna indica]